MIQKDYCWILLCGGLIVLLLLAVWKIEIQRKKLAQYDKEDVRIETEVLPGHLPIRSNEDFYGERTHFTFSPDKKTIAFVQDVFQEYGNDWEKYWALKVLNPSTKKEKTLFVDDTHLSSYVWRNDQSIRVFHSPGPGLRVYKDVSLQREAPIFTKDYRGEEFWILDEGYVQEVKNYLKAERTYRAYEEINR